DGRSTRATTSERGHGSDAARKTQQQQQHPHQSHAQTDVHLATMGKGINTKKASADNPNRKIPKRQKAANMRDKATINRLNMYRNSGPIRNKKGKIVGGSLMMGNKAGGQEIQGAARVQPDRRWFGNTRVVGQKELDKFRNEMSLKAADPYSVVLRTRKLPMGLLQDSEKVTRMKLLETESYEDVFNGKRTRKRAKVAATDYEALFNRAQENQDAYTNKGSDRNIVVEQDFKDEVSHDVFSKGQSKRIWGELYKVLDCSDVVIQVLDARNVPGTRCEYVENHVKKNASHKHLIFVINKCDLVPNWVTKKWVQKLSETTPTLAFHASLNNAFGKGALINLLRQFAKLHQDKKQISVGLIGYPNVGKSSVINALRKKKVCKVAPIPGETKVWQYITLMRRIFLIDCPGVVYDTGDNEVETVLKGVVRAERLPEPTEFIPGILERVKKEYLTKVYGVTEWKDEWDFLEQVANKCGKLLPKGEPDFNNVAVQMINDFQRGKLPWFVAPPLKPEELAAIEEDGDAPLNETNVGDDEAEIEGDDAEEEDDEEEEEADDDEEEKEAADDDDEDATTTTQDNTFSHNISPQEKDALVVDLLLQMDQYRSQRSEAAALGKRMAQQLVRQQQDMKAQHVAEIKRLEQEVHRLTHSHPEVTQLKRQVSMLEAAHADTDKKLQFAVQKLHRSRKREKELRMMNDPLWDL
ncbi:TPA: LOW QUALITY PROTEIN: hypothetical protein N0F65_004295, partial [Lagenidium giganteum]